MSNSIRDEKMKSMSENNKESSTYHLKSWNYLGKCNSNFSKESYYNGSDWRYPNTHLPSNVPNSYSSATYYFNNNAYQCVPSYLFYNYPYTNDINYIYYPINQYQYHNKYYRGHNNYRYNNRNFKKPRAGKQYVYSVKNDFILQDEGEYIDDNITDMQKMKEIETLEDNNPMKYYEYTNFCSSPTNEELCESTSMLLNRVTERAKGYLNLYNHNCGDNIQP